MAAVADAKRSGINFTKGQEEYIVTYDFAVDGGGTGALDLFTANEACMIQVIAKVKTACTSGGSATVEVGQSGATAGLMAQTAVASLTAGAVIDSDTAWIKFAKDAVVIQTIAAAALTAGKIEYLILVRKY